MFAFFLCSLPFHVFLFFHLFKNSFFVDFFVEHVFIFLSSFVSFFFNFQKAVFFAKKKSGAGYQEPSAIGHVFSSATA